MKHLVTGGAGFIGGNFLHFATEKYPSDTFVCLDKLTYAGNLETLSPIWEKPNFRFVKGDVADKQTVFDLFEQYKFDTVIHFAAESHVDRSIENPSVFLITNVIGTQVLLDACVKYGIGRFHQVSTDEVYGSLPLDRPDLLFTETTPLQASSPYSASKAAADLLVAAYHKTYGLNTTISRCSNNYGPYQFPEKLIPLMILNAVNGKPLPVYGDGRNVRDWLHVYDHCTAIDTIVREGKNGEVYNIGGHNEKSNLEVVRAILDILQLPYDRIRFIQDRPGHDLRYAMDPTKLETELHWKPNYTFASGIRPTVEWNLSHREWLDHILSGEYLRFVQRHYGFGM